MSPSWAFISIVFKGDHIEPRTVKIGSGKIEQIFGLESQTLFAFEIGVDSFDVIIRELVTLFIDKKIVQYWGKAKYVEYLMKYYFGVADKIRVFGFDISQVEILFLENLQFDLR